MEKREAGKRLGEALTHLGKCMDILLENPDDENALMVCNAASNGIYLLTLKLLHCQAEEMRPEAVAEIERGAELLARACEAYAGDSTSLENVAEALRALHAYQLCRERLKQYNSGLWKLVPIGEGTIQKDSGFPVAQAATFARWKSY